MPPASDRGSPDRDARRPGRRGPRVRIAAKIFGIALALLVLLAIVAVLSTRSIGRVRGEIVVVAELFTPLASLASAVHVHQLEQEIQLERAIARYARTQDAVSFDDASRLVIAEGRLVDERIASALDLIADWWDRLPRPEDRVELAVLRERFMALEREHGGFEGRALDALEHLARGDRAGGEALLARLPQEEEEFTRELSRLRQYLEDYAATSAAEAADHQQQILRLNTFVTIAAIVAGLLFAGIITSGLVRPIRRLVEGTAEVEGGRLDVHVPVTSGDEIATLTESFNAMVEQLRAKERIKETFGQYIDPRIVEQLLAESVAAAGERRQLTVVFTDIRGFTGVAEHLTPTALVSVINRYFTLMSDPVVQSGGIVDKFIGDAVMAFWSPPFVPPAEHARHACLAALQQLRQLQVLQQELPELLGLRKGAPSIGLRIGIASGDAVVGSIGSDRVKGFTVMGDTVNVASRLEGVGRIYGTEILLSEETRVQAAGAIEVREIDSIRVSGREDPLQIYELLGERESLSDETATLREAFERGLASYRALDITGARAHFEACLEICPGDRPSAVFLERLAWLEAAPPPSWDGVWTLTSK
jgi:class 3 adenylate cyclase